MPNTIDFSTKFGQRVAQQLMSEEVIWLTTIGPGNAPYPRPVWFLWDGKSFLIYSQAKGFKVAHIENNPKVALNLNSDFSGNEVAVFLGTAHIDPGAPTTIENGAYMEKYEKGIIRLGMTPARFADDFSVPIRVVPTKLRGV